MTGFKIGKLKVIVNYFYFFKIMSLVLQIYKRDGRLVNFDADKIKRAIGKAFIEVQGSVNEDVLISIVNEVSSELEANFNSDRSPAVEDVQNLVEMILMKNDFYIVAKAYIIYRYEHSKIRDQAIEEVLEKIATQSLSVKKRDGQIQSFDQEKLKKSIEFFIKDLSTVVDSDSLIHQAESNLYDGIESKEISQALVLSARSHIEKDPAYSKLASRLLNDIIFKQVVGRDKIDYEKYEEQYRQAFIDNIKTVVASGRADDRLLSFNLEELAGYLRPERDDLLVYLGLQVLEDRYFLRDPISKRLWETPQAFWMRVAMGLAILESDKNRRAKEFYEIMSTLRFVPSTPTLFHSGTKHPQLSSCYLTTVDDSLSHIFKCFGDDAQMSKWSGGVANDWSYLRATGALIKGTGVESQGVIPFLKIANDITVAINRSGRRRGATCAYLETWHYDIEDFLELRKNTGDERRRTHDMNTANWIPDLFMQRVQADGSWSLFSPEEVSDLHDLYGRAFTDRYVYYEAQAEAGKMAIHKKIKARDLWKKMIGMLFETGHPWITFKDACNVRSPQDHVGVIHSSNLCTEITLNTSFEETAVCNLGSVNLSKHIFGGRLDESLVKETVTVGMRMLDNVIDVNFYPTIEGKNSNLKHRPVGLGIMGFQDALYMQNINFDSEMAVEFADYSMEVISYWAIMGSSELARERGHYQSFKGSKWDRGLLPVDTIDLLEKERGQEIPVARTVRLDWDVVREKIKTHGMRNSNCMALAPTATISNIAGCFPTIEPIYKNIYVKSNMSGEFTVVNPYLVEDLKALNMWNENTIAQLKVAEGNISKIDFIPVSLRNKYKETFEIDPIWLIRSAAYRGKWIDQSQSLNIFFNGTSGKKLMEIYEYAWKLGVKTTYYLRTLGATSIEKSTTTLTKSSASQLAQAVVASSLLEPVAEVKLCKINDPSCESCQ
jgi:ribonucleoside-diphosphate reductase alpha chain